MICSWLSSSAHWSSLDGSLGHDLGFALAVEHEVVGVGEDLRRAGAQGRDGAGVLGLVHNFGGHAHGELDLVCFHRHDGLSFRSVGLSAEELVDVRELFGVLAVVLM